jgi:hypothetical protein
MRALATSVYSTATGRTEATVDVHRLIKSGHETGGAFDAGAAAEQQERRSASLERHGNSVSTRDEVSKASALCSIKAVRTCDAGLDTWRVSEGLDESAAGVSLPSKVLVCRCWVLQQ